LVKNIISPALSRGKIVLSDRYTDSSLAYQAFGRELPFDMILEINHWATSCLDPDLTFYLKLPVEEGMRRVSTREADRIEAEEISFHRKVESGYRELIEMHPERFSIVNGVSTKQEIHENIIKRVNELLESRK
jgi:dTMP kinase